MPKRKRSKNEYDYISYQIKKLRKKLKHARDRSHSESSSSNESTECTNNTTDNLLDELLAETIVEGETSQNVELPTLTENTELSSNLPPENIDLTLPEDNNRTSEASKDVANLDKDILEILGEDPIATTQYGPEIHKELANRLQHITGSGLTKETRKELQQKYLLPSNCTLLGAPTLNPEIKAALPETLANRDKALETKQKLLASAISCLATTTSMLLESQQINHEVLKKIMDANRMLCDIQHSDSVTRRMFSTSVLKKDVKTQILNTKIDQFLFGESLQDTLKTAKAVSKSSAEIKYNPNNAKKPKPSTFKPGNLNVKTPAVPTRRPPATVQKNRPRAFHQNQHFKSSRTSSQPPKTTSYRR